IFLAQYKFNAPSIGGGDKEEAWKQAEEIAKLSTAEGHKLKGQFYSQEKNYEKAVIEYDEILKLEPENTHIYYLKGIAYQQAEKYNEALNSFESALKIDPEALESLYQIGRNAVFSKTGLDRGIEALNEYLKHKPDKTLPQTDAAYWRLAMIYQIKNDIEKAKEMINKAIAVNPDNDEYKKLLKELN
ncbi:MAG: tetratricopeptide repeat protein, partial [Candidatus Delongbacteria bacterium]|nr:tetratricopeptide repeat protein [Candidatus Delongbacteria bacterium]